ncbi:MAG: mitochondrial fission ELM1 family protein [Rhizobiales bacterium]|nr:mitochondrial fission ELM1 family protein [Hyphomicrobiales bacterium]
MEGARCWLITDGKMGDLAQCVGVAERLGLAAESRVVKPRALFAALMPWGPIDPREVPNRPGSPLAPPFPDLAIASGRRAAAYLRHLKSASGGRVFTVFLKDPRAGAGTADFLWVPQHDRLRGANVLTTLTGPHRFSSEKLAEARAGTPIWPTDGRHKLGVVLGGNSKDFRFAPEDEARLLAGLRVIAQEGATLAVTPSRRTPPGLADAVRVLAQETGGFFWDGTGENPYLAILAQADTLLVTADSTNMVGEAVASGRPVLVFRPTGGSPKIDQHLRELERLGAIRPFQGQLEDFTYEPIDATPVIAIHLARGYAQHLHKKVSP